MPRNQLSKHKEIAGNLVWSSCKFPDPKGKRYFNICCEFFFLKLDKSCQVCFVYVIVTNPKIGTGKICGWTWKTQGNLKCNLSEYPGTSSFRMTRFCPDSVPEIQVEILGCTLGWS